MTIHAKYASIRMNTCQYIPNTYQDGPIHANMCQGCKAPCICALGWHTGCSAPQMHDQMIQILLQMINSVSRIARKHFYVPSNGGGGPPCAHISFMNSLMLANAFTACCFTVAIGAWMAWVQFILHAPERRNWVNIPRAEIE